MSEARAGFRSRVVSCAVAGLLAAPVAVLAQVDGQAVYDRWCAGCHGVDGGGEGPGAGTMLPRPRDFTTGLYQIRTTATGELPTDEDLLHVIDVGMPGTAMPGWEDVLSRAERDALVQYLKTFSRFFEMGDAPPPMEFGRAPRASDEVIARGREVYDMIECWRCHGEQGRGDGESAPTLVDDAGFPIVAADLTKNWTFNGGGTVEDIYRRLRTGLDGTPMPTFSDIVDAGVVSEDDMWALAHFVRSLAPQRAPAVREVVEAAFLTESQVPQTIDDPAWREADRFYIPLAGQIVVRPRWFNPRVEGLWVQALHDGEDLALLVSWTDPSESPNPAWIEYAERVIETMEPRDEGANTRTGARDQLVVQFPQTLSTGMERPYFLQGDSRRSAYLWTWQSGVTGAIESIARGMGTATPQPQGEQHLRAAAQHADGAWRVLILRSLDTGGEGDLALPVGRAVPMAFQAWDGDNGEVGNQAAVSTWYFLVLRGPTPASVYIAPPIALALTVMLVMLVIRQAKRTQAKHPEPNIPTNDGGIQ
ncbi:MAG TPA: c-type cytochrome [Longimicrobiaceae bacterium]|nr:c-type cytochrome [Longimicrobiaceae bacterium]